MGLLTSQAAGAKPVHLTLTRDRVRALKSGSPWVYAGALVKTNLVPCALQQCALEALHCPTSTSRLPHGSRGTGSTSAHK